nr:kelch-like protein 29 [Labrus bergylta]
MMAHFQLKPQSTQQTHSMVLSMPSQSPYVSSQPTVTPFVLTARANQVFPPNPPIVIDGSHLPSHPSLIPSPALPLANRQAVAAAAQAPCSAADNPDGPNDLQMLRTVDMGKYKLSDPGHPNEDPTESARTRERQT